MLKQHFTKCCSAIIFMCSCIGSTQLAVYAREATDMVVSSAALTAYSSSDSSYSVTGGKIYYKITNGNAYVTDCDSNVTSAVIPQTLGGCPVIEISENAFKENKLLKSVTIPSSVTTIGRSAFQDCDSLTSVTIPSTVNTNGYDCGNHFRNPKRIPDANDSEKPAE